MQAESWERALRTAGAGLFVALTFCASVGQVYPQSQPDAEARIAEIEKVVAQGPFSDSWDSLANFKTPDWYEDGKFGIFIHWSTLSPLSAMSGTREICTGRVRPSSSII